MQALKHQFIDPLKDPRWDKFVKNHPLGWVAHLSGWKQVIEKTFPHIKGYFLILVDEKSNEIKAGMPIYEVRSILTGNRLVSIPFATLCDPLISNNEEMDTLTSEAIGLMEQRKLSFLEIKTMHSVPLISHPDLTKYSIFKHNYLELNGGIESLWDNLNHRERRNINKAKKHNLSIKVAVNETDVMSFYKLYAMTRKRLGLPPQPYLFFKALWDVFSSSGYVTILLAEYEKKIVAGHFLLQLNDRISADAIGWDIQYKDINSNHFLYWEGIKRALEKGFKIYDFGRTSPNNQTLLDFKSRWGTKIIDLPFFYYPKAINEKKIDLEKSNAYKLARFACQNTPDKLYSVIGRFFYKHLG